MPSKPKKPCGYPSCPALTDRRYCPEHQRLWSWQYEHYGREPGRGKRYGSAWARIRAAFLCANPLCALCKSDGRITPAELVHHKRKLTNGGTNDWVNLQALCQSCHSRLHAQHGDYFGREK